MTVRRCPLADGMIHDGLWDPYGNCHMGGYAELCAETHGLTKAMQDAHADESYRRAHAASFSDEVTPVTVHTRKGKIVVSTDDGLTATPKPASGAKPAFKKDGGTVTAANASTISDGAAAVVLMSRAAAEAHGAIVLATIRGFGDAEQEPQWFTTAPAAAIPRALKHAGLEGVSAVDYFEINEAFSVVSLANNRLLDIDPAKVRAQAPRRPPQPQEARNRRVCLRVLTTLPSPPRRMHPGERARRRGSSRPPHRRLRRKDRRDPALGPSGEGGQNRRGRHLQRGWRRLGDRDRVGLNKKIVRILEPRMANSTAAPHTLGHERLMRARSRSAACLARDGGPGRAVCRPRSPLLLFFYLL